MSRQSKTLEQVQLALFAEDFDLSDSARAFAEAFLANGEKKRDAVLAVRPDMKPGSAAVRANKWLKDAEVLRYLDWRRAQLVMRASLTEDELVEKARRVYLHGVGDMPVTKDVVTHDDEGGVDVQAIRVRDPNLSAANQAIEALRKIGGFGVERREVAHSGRLGIADLNDEERDARLQDLARRAGLLDSKAGSSK